MEPTGLGTSFDSGSWAQDDDSDAAAVWPPRGFVDNRVPARLAQIALALNPMLYVAAFVLSIVNAIMADIDGEAWAFGALLLSAADPAELALRAATAAVFIAWLHRVSKNTHLLAAERPEQAPVNAIIAWFVPLASFYWPYLIVSEIDRKNDPARPGTTSALVGAWWGAWIAAVLLPQAASQMSGDAAAFVSLMLVGAQVVAATLAILVIRRIQRHQIALATRSDAHAIAAQFA